MPLTDKPHKLGHFLNAVVRGHYSAEEWGRYSPMDRCEGDREHSVKAVLLNDEVDAGKRYDCLFQYFLHGFVTYASPGFERVFYPGMGSRRGYRTAVWKALPGPLPSWRLGSLPAAILCLSTL
jgi:hypothetical protein